MIEKYVKAGKLVSKIRNDASAMIKEGLLVLDLVEFVESEILKSGAEIAFPCNVSINEIAAHYTSPLNDTSLIKAGDLVKLDLGAHIDGFIADSAVTIMAPGDSLLKNLDEETISKNQKLIEASAEGLESAIATVKAGIEVGKIGEEVQKTINSYGFNPIVNLNGHSVEQYSLHSGISVPSIKEEGTKKLKEGDVIAIEPFATDGMGFVTDAPGTYIYRFLKERPFRLTYTKRVLKTVKTNYPSLPFSIRWLNEIYQGNRLQNSLKQLVDAGAIYPFQALKEKTNSWVSQKEHTVIVEKDGCQIITE
ncbi:type II methionyl aminopeptidase [Methanobrevibacter curvatus]|uniref:Methionine aminopeptidase n=1 Tax=Methanobrevibacter curvatus TaxID=49547 RepID=A0A166B4X1_9EURY|nr:type II methionyl aminopeptidase [Methanobrevibacter curvatus]KZX12868.1 methionine aminopeptidase [Methanobrevibacter curvatus]